MEHKITQKQCQEHIDKLGLVCVRCGTKLEPMETIDNSDHPTFWAACMKCKVYGGTDPVVYAIAKKMVENENYIPYNHLGTMPSKKDQADEYEYWLKTQISGACDTVAKVLRIYKSSQFN